MHGCGSLSPPVVGRMGRLEHHETGLTRDGQRQAPQPYMTLQIEWPMQNHVPYPAPTALS